MNNPYRPFFFIGTLASLIGVAVWIAHAMFPDLPYPGRLHAHLMMGLFLMSFVMGFLMTALPRMTQTFATRRFEFVLASLFLGILATLGLYDESERSFFYCILFNVGFLIFFAGTRVLRSKTKLPEFFPLVFWGLASALGGSLLFLSGYEILGQRLFYFNFLLCLVAGIGMRLIPMLLQLPAKALRGGWLLFFLVGGLLTLSTVAEEVWSLQWASYVRAGLLTAVSIWGWRVYTRDAISTGLSWGVRIAAWNTVLGVWGLALFPEYRLEALHVIYVMGFSLMTFMVAARVILAHGNYGIENEVKNLFIKIPIAFLVLAGTTRAAAVFMPSSYSAHLAYASFAFIAGVSIWAYYFLPRVFTNYGQHKTKMLGVKP